MSAISLTQAHRQFEAALPAIDSTLSYQFRHLPRDRRAEAIADARGAAWAAWHGLVRRGKDPLAVGVSGIAFNATRYVKAGRKLGCGAVGRAAIDVYDRRAGLRLVSLDPEADDGRNSHPDTWREWLTEDNRARPADEAAFRIDFAAWLDGLPARKRRVAELLAEGHETGVVAGKVGVSWGRVSQIRSELAGSWGEFQAQAVAV